MTPAQILMAERLLWLAGFVAMVVAVAAFDWRVGLFFGGVVLFASSLDLPRRRS
jgi:hypothetical protein